MLFIMSLARALWFAVQDELSSSVCNSTFTAFDSPIQDKQPSQSSTSIPSSVSNQKHSVLDQLDDHFLLQRFHFSRQCLRFIIDYMHARLRKDTLACPTSTEAETLATVYFYANGSIDHEIIDRMGIGENEAHEAVKTLTKLLSDMSPEFITFPRSYNDRMGVAQAFKNVCGIPYVAGVLGYFHVKVTPPPGQEQMYVNTLGYHSVMMQVIFDLEGNILGLEECCPGGTPEHIVWASTDIGKQFTTFQLGNSWVLGSRGLFGGGHVLTPILASCLKTKAAKRFNKAHAQAYGCVQQVFGGLKSRFQYLRDIGSFQTLNSVANTIKACCVLHNISKKFSVPLPSDCIMEPLHPPSSDVINTTELPYDYMAGTKNQMIEMVFGNGYCDDN